MDQCLKKIGFSEKFCTWISTIYTNPIACIKVNGYLTKHIKISRGGKQGCPLSALLFNIATEILCRKIKESESIEGITLPLKPESKTFKLSQYADDISLY